MSPNARQVMALQFRPNCEYCDRDLPPNSPHARICSYECTFCTDCAENKLHNVCPNCGGVLLHVPFARPRNGVRDCRLRSGRPPISACIYRTASRTLPRIPLGSETFRLGNADPAGELSPQG